MSLSDEVKQAIDQELLKYPADQRQSALLTALRLVQDQHQQKYLSSEAITNIANYLNISEKAVLEAARFYSLYQLKPSGKYEIAICNSISCHLCESKLLIKYFKDKYNLIPNETTPDQKLSLKTVSCLGACIDAPVVAINGQYHAKVTPEKLAEILENLE